MDWRLNPLLGHRKAGKVSEALVLTAGWPVCALRCWGVNNRWCCRLWRLIDRGRQRGREREIVFMCSTQKHTHTHTHIPHTHTHKHTSTS